MRFRVMLLLDIGELLLLSKNKLLQCRQLQLKPLYVILLLLQQLRRRRADGIFRWIDGERWINGETRRRCAMYAAVLRLCVWDGVK